VGATSTSGNCGTSGGSTLSVVTNISRC
jgi:hypothetical protein